MKFRNCSIKSDISFGFENDLFPQCKHVWTLIFGSLFVWFELLGFECGSAYSGRISAGKLLNFLLITGLSGIHK